MTDKTPITTPCADCGSLVEVEASDYTPDGFTCSPCESARGDIMEYSREDLRV
jgi:endogenous inhibitor of DNA gyrase (YacG/DUF329 family)